MKIAIITPYQHFKGGVESVTTLLASIFEEDGHIVTWLTLDTYQPNWYEKLIVKFSSDAIFIKKLYKKEIRNYDLILCNGEYGLGIHHPKCINVFHGSYKGFSYHLKSQINLKSQIHFKLLAYLQKKSSKGKYVVTVSKFVNDILESQGIKVDKIIGNSVDIEKFRPGKSIKLNKYLFVGVSNYFGKGIDVLQKIAQKGVLIDCVTNLEPPKPLGWLKEIDHQSMPELYRKYKGLIFPSRFEASSMVVLEAMSSGLPVFISAVGNGLDIEKIQPNFVVKGWDDESVLEYILKINEIEHNWEKYSQQSRAYVENNHSFQVFKSQWLQLIKGL